VNGKFCWPRTTQCWASIAATVISIEYGLIDGCLAPNIGLKRQHWLKANALEKIQSPLRRGAGNRSQTTVFSEDDV